MVMATKFMGDILSVFTFSGLTIFNSIFLNQQFRREVQQLNRQFFPFSSRIHQLFHNLANQSLHRIGLTLNLLTI